LRAADNAPAQLFVPLEASSARQHTFQELQPKLEPVWSDPVRNALRDVPLDRNLGCRKAGSRREDCGDRDEIVAVAVDQKYRRLLDWRSFQRLRVGEQAGISEDASEPSLPLRPDVEGKHRALAEADKAAGTFVEAMALELGV
jgi:hypothetical protein